MCIRRKLALVQCAQRKDLPILHKIVNWSGEQALFHGRITMESRRYTRWRALKVRLEGFQKRNKKLDRRVEVEG